MLGHAHSWKGFSCESAFVRDPLVPGALPYSCPLVQGALYWREAEGWIQCQALPEPHQGRLNCHSALRPLSLDPPPTQRAEEPWGSVDSGLGLKFTVSTLVWT